MEQTPIEKWLNHDWPEHREKVMQSIKKLDEIHASVATMQDAISNLTELRSISDTLRGMSEMFTKVISGKNVVEVGTLKEILKEQQKGYSGLIKTMCIIFSAFIGVILGVKILFPDWF